MLVGEPDGFAAGAFPLRRTVGALLYEFAFDGLK